MTMSFMSRRLPIKYSLPSWMNVMPSTRSSGSNRCHVLPPSWLRADWNRSALPHFFGPCVGRKVQVANSPPAGQFSQRWIVGNQIARRPPGNDDVILSQRFCKTGCWRLIVGTGPRRKRSAGHRNGGTDVQSISVTLTDSNDHADETYWTTDGARSYFWVHADQNYVLFEFDPLATPWHSPLVPESHHGSGWRDAWPAGSVIQLRRLLVFSFTRPLAGSDAVAVGKRPKG